MPLFRVIDAWRNLPCVARISRLTATCAMVLGVVTAASSGRASLVTFPVSSPQGTISQFNDGSSVATVTFGAISIANGTFAFGNTPPSFGIGLNPTAAPTSDYFFTQNNNNVQWLFSSGTPDTIPILTSGTSIGSSDSYTSSDRFFATTWQSAGSPGYAGLRLASGADFYYGYATIEYVAGSPNQATVTSFVFENVVNTPVVVPEPNMTLPASAGAVCLAALRLRHTARRRFQ